MRWGAVQFAMDSREDSRKVLQYIVIPEANDAITVCCKFGGAHSVEARSIGVLATIKLNHELAHRAGEVSNTFSKGVLPAEFHQRKILAQRTPEYPFDIGGIVAQLARDNRSFSERAM